jgi:glucuronate isomerase
MAAGAAGGYACIGSTCDVDGLCRFLDALEQRNGLPNIILYTLNPADNAVLASLTGSFAQDGVAGKIQFGPAWWYNDFLNGICQQLTALSGYGLLSRFVGMTTDSRSVLSFSRHDYFRRILCNMIGGWVAKGLVPDDRPLLELMVRDISYHNAKRMMSGDKIEIKSI